MNEKGSCWNKTQDGETTTRPRNTQNYFSYPRKNVLLKEEGEVAGLEKNWGSDISASINAGH